MPAKILIVGCGAVTQEHHAPALRILEQRGLAEVVGLCDPAPAQLQSLRSRFPQAQACSSLAELPPRLAEIALVASPVRWHAEQTIQCVKAGMHVLCEKPIASTAAEAAAMNDAARAHGRFLAVGQVRRFCQGAQMIRGLVADRQLGRPLSFRASEGGNFGWPAKSASFFQKKNAGGGVLMDLGVHTLDLLLWWFGQPASFTYEDDEMGGLETNCRLKLNYDSFRGTVQLTRDYSIANGFFLEFEHASVCWQPLAAEQIEITFRGLQQGVRGPLFSYRVENNLPVDRLPAALFHQCFLLQWMNVIAAHQGREALRVPGTEAAVSLGFIERCYATRSFMEPPWFTETEKRRARELHREVAP